MLHPKENKNTSFYPLVVRKQISTTVDQDSLKTTNKMLN